MKQQAKPLATTNSNWLVSLEKKTTIPNANEFSVCFTFIQIIISRKSAKFATYCPRRWLFMRLVSLCVYWCNAFVLKSNIGCIVTASILPTWSTKNNQFEIFNWLLTVAIECIRRTLPNGKGTEMLFLVFGYRKSDGVKWCNQIQMMTP